MCMEMVMTNMTVDRFPIILTDYYSSELFFFLFIYWFFFPDGKERSERAVSEVLCGDAVLNHTGHGHQEQAPSGHLSPRHVPVVRVPEDFLSQQLALLPGHVSAAPEEQRSENVSGGIR